MWELLFAENDNIYIMIYSISLMEFFFLKCFLRFVFCFSNLLKNTHQTPYKNFNHKFTHKTREREWDLERKIWVLMCFVSLTPWFGLHSTITITTTASIGDGSFCFLVCVVWSLLVVLDSWDGFAVVWKKDIKWVCDGFLTARNMLPDMIWV